MYKLMQFLNPVTSLTPAIFFMLFFSSAVILQNQLFRKDFSGIPSEFQTDWIQIRPNVLSCLIGIQTVCRGYQQMTLRDKELQTQSPNLLVLHVKEEMKKKKIKCIY